MEKKFNVLFLNQAVEFLENLEPKEARKILYNIRKSQILIDPKLFKKIDSNIWEFRTLFLKKQFRLFAFWDKSDKNNTVVIATHGIIKKSGKVPVKELEKAIEIRESYFKEKK